MSVITLLTDFGTADEYVGVMKGVILSVNPDAAIVDITHHIAPQDLIHAAYMIHASYPYFPQGTVHVAVVDPGVGSSRVILAVRIGGHILLAPDNGLLTLVMDRADAIIRVDNPACFLQSVSHTFHGRDIFAPVAAHITKGVDISSLGTPADLTDLVRLDIHQPFISEDELIGTIVSVDRFGNLITNIDLNILEIFCKKKDRTALCLRIGRDEIVGLSESYASAGHHQPLGIIGSRGYLEIAVNCGSAKTYFKAEKGDIVKVLHAN